MHFIAFGIILLRVFNHHDVVLYELVGRGFGKSSAGMEHGINMRQVISLLQSLQGVDKMPGLGQADFFLEFFDLDHEHAFAFGDRRR